MKLLSFMKRIFIKIKKEGLSSFISLVVSKLTVIIKKRDILQLESFISKKTFYSKTNIEFNKKTINWVVPNFIANGSGGHLNIFRMISNLEKLGFENRIIIVENSHYLSGKEAKSVIEKNYLPPEYLPLKAEVSIGRDSFLPSEFTIATEWKTAYTVRDFQSTKYKCYFIQDYEPNFYSPGSYSAFAENTYKFGFKGIISGAWIYDKLKKDFDMDCCSIGFSYDKKLYSIKNLERRKVFYYARPETPRRGFELGILALNELKKKLENIEIILGGSDVYNFNIPFKYEGLGHIKVSELPNIYNTVKVALVLSFTNLSLLPYELMACGASVVINRGPSNEWGLNDSICSIVEAEPEKIADEIYNLLTNEEMRLKKANNALEFINKTDWFEESKKVAEYLNKIDSSKS